MGVVARIRRLLASNAELEDLDLAEEGAKRRCSSLSQCSERQRVKLYGVVHSVTANPCGGAHVFLATLDTGNGDVELRWLGRKKVDGVTLGRALVVEGRLVRVNGALGIFNPVYEIVEAEEPSARA
jgi:RecG-like helicase